MSRYVILVAVLVLVLFFHLSLYVPVPSAGPVQTVHESWEKVFSQNAGAPEAWPLSPSDEQFVWNVQHKNNPSNNTNIDQKRRLLVFHPASSRNRTILRSHCDRIRGIETLQPVTVTWPNKSRSKDKQTFFKIYPLTSVSVYHYQIYCKKKTKIRDHPNHIWPCQKSYKKRSL